MTGLYMKHNTGLKCVKFLIKKHYCFEIKLKTAWLHDVASGLHSAKMFEKV